MTTPSRPDSRDENAPRKRGRPPSVDQREVVKKARQIVVSDGVDSLTMRKLGAALGLDPMVPYRFFDTKDDLLEAVFLDVVSDVRPTDDSDPVSAVASAFLEFRTAMLEAPSLFQVVGPRLLSTPAAMVPAGWVVRRLVKAGLDTKDALDWNTILLTHVVGSLSFADASRTQLPDPPAGIRSPSLAGVTDLDVEQQFELGFGHLLAALRSETQRAAS